MFRCTPVQYNKGVESLQDMRRNGHAHLKKNYSLDHDTQEASLVAAIAAMKKLAPAGHNLSAVALPHCVMHDGPSFVCLIK